MTGLSAAPHPEHELNPSSSTLDGARLDRKTDLESDPVELPAWFLDEVEAADEESKDVFMSELGEIPPPLLRPAAEAADELAGLAVEMRSWLAAAAG